MRRSISWILLLSLGCSEPEPPRPTPALTDLGQVLQAVTSYVELNGSWPDRLDSLVGPDSLAPGLPLRPYVLSEVWAQALRDRGLLTLMRGGRASQPAGAVAALSAEACAAWQLGKGPVVVLGLHEGCTLIDGTRPAHLFRAPRREGLPYPHFLFLVGLAGPEPAWLGVLAPDGQELARVGD